MMQFEFPLGSGFSQTPFPHGQFGRVFGPFDYADLVYHWPSESLFKTLTGAYRKLALSERCNPKEYGAFLIGAPHWRAFYKYVKSPAFVTQIFELLKKEARIAFPATTYSARFEFSSLPSEGGAIAPHRDIPSKILTIVAPMTLEAVPGWGTDILEPRLVCRRRDEHIEQSECRKEPVQVGKDYETPLDAFSTVTSFAYAPNTCGIFVKTENSWHAIGPLKGPAGAWRRTLTVNIERAA
jgi:hypothetical protein